jgi:hypothetical protein
VFSAGRSRTWLTASGSILVVVLLIAGAYIAHHDVVNTRAIAPVPPPPAPPLTVVAVTSPGPSYELLAEDAVAGHMVALASASQPICPPIGLCPPPAPLSSLVIFNGAGGTILSRTSLQGSGASESVLLLVDDQVHVAYAVAPHSVSLFSTLTGELLGGYALPASVVWTRETGGTYDARTNALILAGGEQLAILDATTGQLRSLARIAAPGGVDGPVLDAVTDTLFLLALDTSTAPATLLAYNAVTLAPLWQLPVPQASGLGPLTPDAQFLALYEQSGKVVFQPSLPGSGSARALPAADGATALGWTNSSGAVSSGSLIYVATATGIDLRNVGNGQVLATLPLRVAWSGAAPLLVDARTTSVYLPSSHGQVVIARYSGSGSSSLNAETAVVLAHGALAHFLPFTNQDPPFITPESFLLSATPGGQTIPMTYWIHYVDFQWSLGPYPGTTSAVVAPNHDQEEGYLVTFTITWNETFLRTHSWVCAVAPDGSVALRSDSGDIVP